MQDFWHTVPGWLIGVVGLGIAINLASAYLKPATDRWIGSTVLGLKFRLPFGAKILEPSEGVVTHGATIFKGRYRFTFGARFAVYRYDGRAFWPQTPIEYDRTQKRWSVSVYVADEPNQQQTIILAAISSDMKALHDYYGQVHERAKEWIPIRFHDVPPGLIELDRVTVYSRH